MKTAQLKELIRLSEKTNPTAKTKSTNKIYFRKDSVVLWSHNTIGSFDTENNLLSNSVELFVPIVKDVMALLDDEDVEVRIDDDKLYFNDFFTRSWEKSDSIMTPKLLSNDVVLSVDKEATKRVYGFLSDDEAREVIQSVSVTSEGEMVATNGHVLALVRTENLGHDYLITKNMSSIICDVTSVDSAARRENILAYMNVTSKGFDFSFAHQDFDISTNFPNFRQVLPVVSEMTLVKCANRLGKEFEKIHKMSSKVNKMNLVAMCFEPSGNVVYKSSGEHTINFEVDSKELKYCGDMNRKIGVDTSYLKLVGSSMDSDNEYEMYVTDSMNPIMFVSTDGKDTFVVMPMRL